MWVGWVKGQNKFRSIWIIFWYGMKQVELHHYFNRKYIISLLNNYRNCNSIILIILYLHKAVIWFYALKYTLGYF